MPKVKEITVGVGFTKSLPNYQNIKFNSEITMSLEEGDDPDKVYKKAWDKVGSEITKQISLFEDQQRGVKKGL